MKNIVVIGGGTGTYIVLTGLKEYPVNLSAIVAMSDSGGSTGILRDELGALPPGDIRRALVALSQSPQIIRDLFNYRFENGGLGGHSFGNLFLTALEKITGDFEKAVEEAGKILSIRGQVIPVTKDSTHLHAILEDGTEIAGETNIDIPKHDGTVRIEKVFLEPSAKIFEETAQAIKDADLIIIGPGDPYTSIIPNLLVKGMAEALRASKAKKIAVMNLMSKWGETHEFAASDMVREILKYSGFEKFDCVICNTAKMDSELVSAYEKEKKFPIHCDDKLSDYAREVKTGDYFSEADIARHDSAKIARVIAIL